MIGSEQKRRTACIVGALLFFGIVQGSVKVPSNLPINHKDTASLVPKNSELKMEARVNDDDDELDLGPLESNNIPRQQILAFKESDHPVGSSGSEPPGSPEEKKMTQKTSPVPVVIQTEERSWKSVKASMKDSYVDALEHSHTSNDPNEGVVHVDVRPKVSKTIKREYIQGPVYRPETNYGAPNDPNIDYGTPSGSSYLPPKSSDISYGVPRPAGPTQQAFLPTPSNSYSLPDQSSGNFNDAYGTPQNSYGTPRPNYGVPGPSYGPAPLPQNSYGVPANGYPPSTLPQQGEARAYGAPAPVYGAPYSLPDFSSLPTVDFAWPFALKLNAFTLAKIILKLVIFKMIVKFIAAICLLLFIPKLAIIKKGNNGGSDYDEEGRNLVASNSTLERLNILTSLVTSSIDKYKIRNEVESDAKEICSSFGCRIRKILTSGESWSDYATLFKSYIAEEREIADREKR